jgi:hypothetical protein
MSDKRCWGCENGFAIPSSSMYSYPGKEKLEDVYRKVKRLRRDPMFPHDHVYITLHRTYDKEVLQACREQNIPCIEWDVDMIRDHLEYHVEKSEWPPRNAYMM